MAGLSVTDLAGMRALVKDWADRSDLGDSIIDNFINIAVQRANRLTKVPAIEAVATIPLVNDDVPLPSDYLESKQLTVTLGGVVRHLERKDIHFVESLASAVPGNPEFFARKLTNFVLAPRPQSVTEAELYYWRELDSLVDDVDTNWYITDGSTAILYGALKELGVYISDEQYAASWEGQFQNALVEIQRQYDTSEWSGDTLSVTL